jgi:hypothetical protein
MLANLKTKWRQWATPIDEHGLDYCLVKLGMTNIQREYLPKLVKRYLRQEKLDVTILTYTYDFTHTFDLELFKKQVADQGITYWHATHAGEFFIFDNSNDAHLINLMRTASYTVHISEVKKFVDNLV